MSKHPARLILLATLAVGCAESGVQPTLDDDGDGLDNATEAAGWSVTVHGPSGVPDTRHVAPRIDLADTDGDGLDDAEERTLMLDPTRADTDGDGLDDRLEIEVLHSRADRVDSDGDADGDPRFFDRSEVEDIGTSPALADTDGDGFDDRYEVVELLTDPLIADLPQFEFSVLDIPEIGLNTRLTTGETDVVSVGESATRTVSMSNSDSRTTSESFALEVGFGIEAGWAGGIHVVASFDTRMTTTRQLSLTLSREYTESAAAEVNRTRQRSVSRDLTFEDGYVAFPVRLANRGKVAFTLKNASMTLFHRDPKYPWRRRALGHVETHDGRTMFPQRSLGPGDSHEGVYFRKDGLGWDDAIALMQDPRGIELSVSGYELVDAEGRPFAHDGTARRGRTATLVIDHGPGYAGGHSVSSDVVATNLRFDPETGEPAGLFLVDAIEGLLDRTVEFGQVRGPDGLVSVVTTVDGHRAEGSVHDPSRRGRWSVVRVRGETGEIVLGDAHDMRLMPGDAVHLIYDEDLDGDGLVARVEARLGTSDLEVDTDGDGLGDAEEVVLEARAAEMVPILALGDPTRADTDGDGLADLDERDRGSSPFAPDTDLDGLPDLVDRAPTTPDVYTLADFSHRTIDDGAAVELRWAALDNPAIERIHLLRQPVSDLGEVLPAVADALEYDIDDLADAVGADAAFTLEPGATTLVDQPPAEVPGWVYLAYVHYAGVGLMWAGEEWVDETTRRVPVDRVQVRLERMVNTGDDDCDVYWEMAVAPGRGVGELDRRRFQLSPDGAIEIDEDTVIELDALPLSREERQGELELTRDGTGLTVFARMFRQARRGPERLGYFEPSHTRAEIDAGGAYTLVFDSYEDPGECRIELTYRLAVAELDVPETGP